MDGNSPAVLLLACGGAICAGFVLGWLLSFYRTRSGFEQQLGEAKNQIAGRTTQTQMLQDQLKVSEQELSNLRSELNQERQSRTTAETRIEEVRKNIEEQKAQFEQARIKLEDTFKALSSEALDRNSRVFQEQAKRGLEVVLETAKGEISSRHQAIDATLKPIPELLKNYQEQIRALENKRESAYGSLSEQLRELGSAQEKLSQETLGLVGALRGHKVRGRWGELALHRVVELSGMTEHCDFTQQTTADGDSQLRPDMIVNLPGDRRIVVDVKTPMDAYLDAVEAEDEQVRKAAMERHARNVREHLKLLGRKEYWKQIEGSPELVVMFIPGESFFSAALEIDPELIEYGAQHRLIIASPTTLIALLRAVEFGWRQEQVAKSALEVSKIGKELYERLRTFAGHLTKLGTSLDRSVKNYNSAVGSLERSVLPAARRFPTLGAGDGAVIGELKPVEESARSLAASELLEFDADLSTDESENEGADEE